MPYRHKARRKPVSTLEIRRLARIVAEAPAELGVGRTPEELPTARLGDTGILYPVGGKYNILGLGVRSPRGSFRFVDLFAGIGGMRLGLEAAGGTCVYSVEIDRFARRTYEVNYGHAPEAADIRDVQELPPHDVLAAGFPCQPFSLAGVTKKKSLGRQHGFLDQTQGTLFFELARLIQASQPPVVLLENVKHLLRHDNGRTYNVIKGTLEELGYTVSEHVIDARAWVPQHRERVFIVGLRQAIYGDRRFMFPPTPSAEDGPRLASVLASRVAQKYTLSLALWRYLQAYAKKHAAMGNGFGFGLFGRADVARTLSARYYKDGSEILIRNASGRPRRLTPRECARLMGFPSSFRIACSDTQAYRQFGNAVVVGVVAFVARTLVEQTGLGVNPRLGIISSQSLAGRSTPSRAKPAERRAISSSRTTSVKAS